MTVVEKPSFHILSSVCFVLQLLGAAFLAIGLWAWAEKVRINTLVQTHAEVYDSQISQL